MTTGSKKAKGYKPKRTLYELDFSETEHAGLEVTARGVPMGQLLNLMDISEQLEELEELDEDADRAAIAGKIRELLAPFARILVAWNLLDEDDAPVPASLDGLMTQEPAFVQFILTAYTTSLTQAPPPLPGGAASGSTSPGALTQAAALSSALPSS